MRKVEETQGPGGKTVFGCGGGPCKVLAAGAARTSGPKTHIKAGCRDASTMWMGRSRGFTGQPS